MGGTVRTGTDGEGWSCSVYLLLLAHPARGIGCLQRWLLRSCASARRTGDVGSPPAASPRLPGAAHEGPLARAPSSQRAPLACCPSAQRSWKPYPAEAKINERQIIRGGDCPRLCCSLLWPCKDLETQLSSFSLYLCNPN